MSCPDCFKGAIHNHSTPQGKEEKIHGNNTYVAQPATALTSQSTILFITDAFGLNLVNNKLLADKYASATGLRVLVPDLIPGGGCSLNVIGHMDKLSESVAWY